MCLSPRHLRFPILAWCAQHLVFALVVLTCLQGFLDLIRPVGTEPTSSWAVRKAKRNLKEPAQIRLDPCLITSQA